MTFLVDLAVMAVLAVVLGVAAHRGTQLVVHDTIAAPIRDRVFDWQARRPEARARRAVVTLISCTYCAGWWVSGVFLAVVLLATGRWHETPLVVHGVEWFAVAGVQALLNRWDDTRKTA
ncbi:DUF1360 domain-containing protein [Streptomyces sp. URMC 125]|uniref:DUF1360 domain-containing protein n=1 Tax=Streptomyces sp. URMC 125 TaxID=3423419 RepID=UPI003F1D8133